MDRAVTSIGVVIVDYLRPDLTMQAVESVFASRDVDASVVVVDNDPAAGHGLPDGWPADLRRIVSGSNLGYAGGMNSGAGSFADPAPDLFCLLNNDAVLDPSALALAVAAFDSDPRLQIAALNQIQVGADGAGQAVTSCAAIRGRREVPIGCAGDCSGPGWHLVDLVSGPALLVRSAAFNSVGGLDEHYFHYYEEVDLAIRVLRRTGRGALLCRARVHHAAGSTLDHESPDATYYRVRNYLRYRRKLYDNGAVVATLRSRPFLARCARGIAGVVRGDRDGASAVLAGWRDGRRGRTGPRNEQS